MQQYVAPGAYRALACAGIVAATVVFGFASATPAGADSGYATWYGPGFQGNEMYNGQIFDMYDPTTTACNIYPLGTWLRVTNPATGKSVVVQVRDRGAFHHAVDLSYAAFLKIANPALMVIPVTYQVVSGPDGDAAPARPSLSSRGSRPAARAAPSDQYVVQPGDTLGDLAIRFGVDPRALAAWNGIADPNAVEIGQTLRLTAPSIASTAPPTTTTYAVQAGDTLFSIAGRFGVSVDQLAAANGLANPDDVPTGITLTIPRAQPQGGQTYIVQAGDSVASIADRFGITPARLAEANQLADPAVIQPGTQLTIPAT